MRVRSCISVAMFAALLAGRAFAVPAEWTPEDLLRFAPEVRLHHADPYRPSSVDWFLENAEVVHRPSGNVVASRPAAHELPVYWEEGASDHYLRLIDTSPTRLNDTVYLGDPLDETDPDLPKVESPAYVHVIRGPEGAYYDLQYIFFYPFNGPQTGRMGLAEYDNLLNPCTTVTRSYYWPPFATHQGDFEQVTVRVDANFSEIIAANYFAHGTPRWYFPESLEMNEPGGTHPVVYSALASHASYPFRDPGITLFEFGAAELIVPNALTCGPISCGIVGGIHWLNFADDTWTGTGTVVWRPWENGGGLVELRFEDGLPIDGQEWAAFPGRWGEHWPPNVFQNQEAKNLCVGLGVEGGCSDLGNCATGALYAATDAAEFVGLLPADKLDRNGPTFLSGAFVNGDDPLVIVEGSDHDVPALWGGRGYNWLGDLDGNGVDEIVSGRSGQMAVKWYLGGGAGFSNIEYGIDGVWGDAQFTWLMDYDGDGRDEIVTAIDKTLHIKRLTGRGALQQFEADSYVLSVANYNSGWWNWTGDLDGDGQDEIVSASGTTVWVKWYRKDRDDWRQTVHSVSTPWGGEGGNWVADLEGDGVDEIVSAVGGNVYVKRYEDGAFVADAPYPVRNEWSGNFSNWAGDLDGDGLLDLVTAVGSTMFVKHFDGGAFVSGAIPGVTGWGPHGLDSWIGDLENDGVDEIVSANATKVFVKRVEFQPSGTETGLVPEPGAGLMGTVVLGLLAVLRHRMRSDES